MAISNDKKLKNTNKNSDLDSKEIPKEVDISNHESLDGVHSGVDEHSNNETIHTSDGISNNNGVFFLDVAVLNELSKASQMAMSNISFIAKKINDTHMKKELVAIYSQYSNILLQINQHFEKFGEIPDGVSKHAAFASECALKANLQFDKSPSHIAEIMIQGLQMGIIKSYKLINSNYDIEESTCDLLNTFLDFQKENIKKLNAYL